MELELTDQLQEIRDIVKSAGAIFVAARKFGNEWLISFYCDPDFGRQAMDTVARELQYSRIYYNTIVQHDTHEMAAEDWPLFVQGYIDKAARAGVKF